MLAVNDETGFWQALDHLVGANELVVDRPQGSQHPRYPTLCYPLDYGYLAGTRSGDGDGIDIWIGSLPERRVIGVICTVDVRQRDAELKVLLACTPEEAQIALAVHNQGGQTAILVTRPPYTPSTPI